MLRKENRKGKSKLKLYTSNTFSDEEGEAKPAKVAILYGSKKEILEIAAFFQEIFNRLEKSESCHMHFADFSKTWKKRGGIDIEINVT